MGFHGKKRNGGIAMMDKRMKDRWERSQATRLQKAIAASPDEGGTPETGERLKYGALIDRLRKRAALANGINEFGLEGDLLDAAAALGELKETH